MQNHTLNEFDIISRIKAISSQQHDVALGIGDDCALVTLPFANNKEQWQLAITCDTMNVNVHFFENISPVDLAYRAVAVNISDLAAMAATPRWLTLSLSAPTITSHWLDEFLLGLKQSLDIFDVQLIGGDTCRGPLSITITAHGLVAKDKALTRTGAKPGDIIYVTGSLGGAHLALEMLLGNAIGDDDNAQQLQQRLWRPQPRLREGTLLAEYASAAIDISDGLIADLGHILHASNVGATIEAQLIPIHPLLQQHNHLNEKDKLQYALSGGDDYELCFTIPANLDSEFQRKIVNNTKKHSNLTQMHAIGKISEQMGCRVIGNHGNLITIPQKGYEHF